MNNVIPLFSAKKTKAINTPAGTELEDVIHAVVNWAEHHGIDVYNDIPFMIRVSDLMAHLKVMAQESKKIA